MPKSHIIHEVPYFSQWESPELVKRITNGTFDSSKDPNWKSSGAKTKEEYSLWSANACGMACTKMIIANELHKIVPIVVLCKKATTYGAYTFPLETSPGLLYKPYVKFLKSEFNLEAKIINPLTINEILIALHQDNYVIASVSPGIRTVERIPPAKGGHLVLLLGYDLSKKEIYFHNPSGFTEQTRHHATLSFDDFTRFFGMRGIIITRSKHK